MYPKFQSSTSSQSSGTWIGIYPVSKLQTEVSWDVYGPQIKSNDPEIVTTCVNTCKIAVAHVSLHLSGMFALSITTEPYTDAATIKHFKRKKNTASRLAQRAGVETSSKRVNLHL
jgi:hypothetical protein